MPLKCLPIKINKPIVDNNIITLPLINTTRSLKYSSPKDNCCVNNILGLSQMNKYNSSYMSYQDLPFNNKPLSMSFKIPMKGNNSTTAFN